MLRQPRIDATPDDARGRSEGWGPRLVRLLDHCRSSHDDLAHLGARRYESHYHVWAGLALVFRYHFLSLGRFVPYAEIGGGPGGTDLKVKEIDSDFSFLVWGGLGVSVFLTDSTAMYAGYRYEHNSNGNTDKPNRGWESHVGLVGVSYYFR